MAIRGEQAMTMMSRYAFERRVSIETALLVLSLIVANAAALAVVVP
jgi:hypothetical protein